MLGRLLAALLILVVVAVCRVVWMIRIYPHDFHREGQFENMLHLSDDVDPWTTWSKEDLQIACIGRTYAKRVVRLVVGCLMRDVERELPYIKKKLSAYSAIFKQVHVIIMENDSRDGTRGILLSWARKSPWENITFVCVNPVTFQKNDSRECQLGELFSDDRQWVSRGRIERMAYLRTRLHEYTCAWLKLNTTFQYVLYTDLDLHGIVYRRGIQHSFGCLALDPTLQVMGFRGTTENGWYWDSYAYEPVGGWMGNPGQLVNCKLASRKMGISQGLVPVICSFSGGTFIRSRDMDPTAGFHVMQVGPYALCEHIAFYRQFAHIYVNTNMIQTHTNFETHRTLSTI